LHIDSPDEIRWIIWLYCTLTNNIWYPNKLL
jgi:hypothetical protein